MTDAARIRRPQQQRIVRLDDFPRREGETDDSPRLARAMKVLMHKPGEGGVFWIGPGTYILTPEAQAGASVRREETE